MKSPQGWEMKGDFKARIRETNCDNRNELDQEKQKIET
jgi:hypothetical protein